MRKIGEDSDEEEKSETKDGGVAVKDDPKFSLTITKGTRNFLQYHDLTRLTLCVTLKLKVLL